MEYRDQADENIQNGFQLYLHARVGWRFEFFNRRWFVEPVITFNYWPVTTNRPAGFDAIEEDYTNYTLFDPNIYFGFRF